MTPAFYMEARHSGKEYIQGGKKKEKINYTPGRGKIEPRTRSQALPHVHARANKATKAGAGEARKN